MSTRWSVGRGKVETCIVAAAFLTSTMMTGDTISTTTRIAIPIASFRSASTSVLSTYSLKNRKVFKNII